ncbi:MAG: PAS domain-containing protein, partial [Planctomycetales bacterium]
MTASWVPVIVVDICGAAITLVLAMLCARYSLKWSREKPQDTFAQYVLYLTMAIVLFAMSRSCGHIIKQVLLLAGEDNIWKAISPFSGAVNTAAFIIIFGVSLSFHRFHAMHQELQVTVKERTRELELTNKRLLAEIAERKRVEEQVHLLLNSMAEALYSLDLEGHCTQCNPACVRMLGYENADQLLGENLHQLIHHTRSDGSPYPENECRI